MLRYLVAIPALYPRSPSLLRDPSPNIAYISCVPPTDHSKPLSMNFGSSTLGITLVGFIMFSSTNRPSERDVRYHFVFQAAD